MSTRPHRMVLKAKRKGMHSVLYSEERAVEEQVREALNELELYLRLARDEVERLQRL